MMGARLLMEEEEITQNERLAVFRGMRKYGGHFVVGLAGALIQADVDNTRLIKDTWPEYWDKYRDMGKEGTNEKR